VRQFFDSSHPEENLQDKFCQEKLAEFFWECTGELVDEVVGHYVRTNGLKNLKSEQRRRIAAWVLFVVEESRKLGRGPEVLAPLQILPEQMNPEPVVEAAWMSVVWGLMDVNILYSGDDGDVLASFDRPDENSVVLSPALVIVLFTLLGGQAGIVSSWEGLEHVTALFAFRQLVLNAVRTCRSDGNLQTFKQTLSELRFTKKFDIPLLSHNIVWINGPVAPYADVVTRGFFYQSKDTESDTIDVFLMFEISKCGLLNDEFIERQDENVRKRARCGFIVTKGLVKVWNDASEVDPPKAKSGAVQLTPKEVQQRKQESRAYPECMLSGPRALSDVRYKTIKQSGESEPFEFTELITFVLSFNKKKINLKLNFPSKAKKADSGPITETADGDETAPEMQQETDETTSNERRKTAKSGEKGVKRLKNSHGKSEAVATADSIPLDIQLEVEDLDEDGVFDLAEGDERKVSWDYVKAALRKNIEIKFLWTGE
jgi:hypothetical protein